MLLSRWIHQWTHYADVLAIPLFLTIAIALSIKPNRSKLETGIMIFAWVGFILDSIFTINYFWLKM